MSEQAFAEAKEQEAIQTSLTVWLRLSSCCQALPIGTERRQ
jgi:hypothetical protein